MILDAAIKAVSDKMKGDQTKTATFYYLLAEHFGKLPTLNCRPSACRDSSMRRRYLQVRTPCDRSKKRSFSRSSDHTKVAIAPAQMKTKVITEHQGAKSEFCNDETSATTKSAAAATSFLLRALFERPPLLATLLLFRRSTALS